MIQFLKVTGIMGGLVFIIITLGVLFVYWLRKGMHE